MSLQVPTTGADLLALGKDMYNGLLELGVQLKITQMTPAEFEVFVSDFETADNNFNAARSAESAASGDYQRAQTANDDWLATVKGVLVGCFGTIYTTEWAQAGFVNNTTAIPNKVADRIALTGRLTAFFTKSPSYEVPTMKVTAAEGKARQKALADAQIPLTNATRDLKTLGQTWDAAYKALTDTEWTLIKLLQASLNSDDTRWLAFGLQMPSTPSTPGQPVNLTAHQDSNGGIVVQNDPTPLATRYRYRMLLVGVDTAYALAASSPIPLATITGVEPGRTVRIIVQAVNGTLQGVASKAVEFTVVLGAAKAPDAKPATTLVETLELTANGNGNGHRGTHANGNGAHARVV